MTSTSVALTDFHAKPGEVIDRSQAGPVTLTKRNRAYAVVVSADWFERAEEALKVHHGNRRVLVADALSDADRDFIRANGPTDEEARTGEWRTSPIRSPGLVKSTTTNICSKPTDSKVEPKAARHVPC